MTDGLDDQLDSVSERAKKLGVSGGSSISESPEQPETDLGKSDEVVQNEPSSTDQLSGIDSHVYPNPDKDLGSLSNTYEKMNVFVAPEMREAVEELWLDLDYEWTKSQNTELEKNWDFYMACFRVILANEDLLRQELGMESNSED